MIRLLVEQNQFFYVGTFSRPPFQLWGAGAAIVGGLFEAFAPWKVTLADIRIEGATQVASDQGVTVTFSPGGIYRFRFDRVDSAFINASDHTLDDLPRILGASETWLRKAAPDLSFKMHQYQYWAHSALREGSADTLLERVVQTTFKAPQEALRSGVILKWNDETSRRAFQLTLDHSQIVHGGLFIWFVINVLTDRINHSEEAAAGRALLDRSLGQLGLAFTERG